MGNFFSKKHKFLCIRNVPNKLYQGFSYLVHLRDIFINTFCERSEVSVDFASRWHQMFSQEKVIAMKETSYASSLLVKKKKRRLSECCGSFTQIQETRAFLI